MKRRHVDADTTTEEKETPSEAEPLSSAPNLSRLMLLPVGVFVGLPLLAFGYISSKKEISIDKEVSSGFVITVAAIAVSIVASRVSMERLQKAFGRIRPPRDESTPSPESEIEHEFVVVEKPWVQPKVIMEQDPDPKIPTILDDGERQLIAEHVLPRALADHRWRRVYCLARDGDAFVTCLRALDQERRTLVVIRTTKNRVLGGYADMPWKTKGGMTACSGPGACVFRVRDGGVVEAYPWSGANRYTQLVDVERERLAMGAGAGYYGWSIERNFMVGTTGRCPTFENEPLCDEKRFEIVDLEIFGFVVG